MDKVFCINTNSLPAVNLESANALFTDSLQGTLQLFEDEDRFFFYLDCNEGSLRDLELAAHYSYEQYLEEIDDPDFKLFLLEVEDKSPALDFITDEELDHVTENHFYMLKCVDKFPEVYGLAWCLSAYLISLNTEERWASHQLDIFRSDSDGNFIDEPLFLRNISVLEHGKLHSKEDSEPEDISRLIGDHLISPSVIDWHESLSPENQHRVFVKLQLACKLNFQGGEPLFKTLNDADGIREIRFSAYNGGVIRVLFKHFKNSQNVILSAFIKKSNDEGYKQNIAFAKEEYQSLTQS